MFLYSSDRALLELKKPRNKEPKSVAFEISYYPDPLGYPELRTAQISPNKLLSYNSH